MTLALHFLELPNRYPFGGIARIPSYIVTARERKPPVADKTLKWTVAKELQVVYRRWQKGGPQCLLTLHSAKIAEWIASTAFLISGDGGNLRR